MDPDQARALHTFTALAPFFFVFILFVWAIVIIPFYQIYKKAGFSPWLCLLMIVPLANIITLYVVAFSNWRVMPVPSIYPAQYPPQYPPPTYQPPAPPPVSGPTPPTA